MLQCLSFNYTCLPICQICHISLYVSNLSSLPTCILMKHVPYLYLQFPTQRFARKASSASSLRLSPPRVGQQQPCMHVGIHRAGIHTAGMHTRIQSPTFFGHFYQTKPRFLNISFNGSSIWSSLKNSNPFWSSILTLSI